jgi:uncharacterized membrane protein YebE (DUF533 family)
VPVNSLDVERLLGSVISGALGGKKKKHRGASRFLTGGKSSFLNASTLLALGGLAWGVYESMSQASGGPGTPGPVPAPPPAPRSAMPSPVAPPPLPVAGPAGAAVVPPPLPGRPAPAAAPATPEVSPEVLRVIRLTLSAARADGTLTGHEREAILAQARSVGAEALIAAELDTPTPLEDIVRGATGGRAAEDLYTLAFSIVRADEQVLPTEREYLTRLSRLLGVEAETATRLEQQAVERITSAGRE